MQFGTKKILAVLLVLISLQISQNVLAQSYAIQEMGDQNTRAVCPFSISRVMPFDGGLRLFISTNSVDAVANLLASGALKGQLSDHQTETEAPVSLALGKAIWCTVESDPVYLDYSDPLPGCGGQAPAAIEYFIQTAVALGLGRDLAIGEDPDFLWLVEEQ